MAHGMQGVVSQTSCVGNNYTARLRMSPVVRHLWKPAPREMGSLEDTWYPVINSCTLGVKSGSYAMVAPPCPWATASKLENDSSQGVVYSIPCMYIVTGPLSVVQLPTSPFLFAESNKTHGRASTLVCVSVFQTFFRSLSAKTSSPKVQDIGILPLGIFRRILGLTISFQQSFAFAVVAFVL